MKGVTGIGALIGWGLFALMAANVVWCTFLMWQTSRASRLDPLTNVTRACDFSEDVSEFYEKERRIYAIKNKTFAESFAALNRDRAWTMDDQSRSMKLSFAVAIGMLLALGGVAALITIFR
jgi:succinate dehydrogenase/fumarate reductase-like Fe-S protein